MKFRKIVLLDDCGLVSPYKEKIYGLSQEKPDIYESHPEDNREIIRRIGDADCVLVSWRTPVDAEVLRSVSSVKYVGMCCSLYDEASANVDIQAARAYGIDVKGVRDYGDNGTVEFIFAELIYLLKGLGKQQWKNEPTELTGRTIGIIGMGVLGTMVAETALCFGMKVLYYSRTRKPGLEKPGLEYADLDTLLSQSDIVTTHLPRNTVVITAQNIGLMKQDAIYINTSLGQPFETDPFLDWIGQNRGNYAIFDSAGYSTLADVFRSYSNIRLFDKSSGFTSEAKVRLTRKVWENMTAFLG